MTHPEKDTDKSKTLIALGCIVLAAAGLVLGFLFPVPLGGTFSIGTLLALTAFLLSLSAVKDRGSNMAAILALFTAFISMSVSIFFSGMAAG